MNLISIINKSVITVLLAVTSFFGFESYKPKTIKSESAPLFFKEDVPVRTEDDGTHSLLGHDFLFSDLIKNAEGIFIEPNFNNYNAALSSLLGKPKDIDIHTYVMMSLPTFDAKVLFIPELETYASLFGIRRFMSYKEMKDLFYSEVPFALNDSSTMAGNSNGINTRKLDFEIESSYLTDNNFIFVPCFRFIHESVPSTYKKGTYSFLTVLTPVNELSAPQVKTLETDYSVFQGRTKDSVLTNTMNSSYNIGFLLGLGELLLLILSFLIELSIKTSKEERRHKIILPSLYLNIPLLGIIIGTSLFLILSSLSSLYLNFLIYQLILLAFTIPLSIIIALTRKKNATTLNPSEIDLKKGETK